jgi:hypothetical protein
MEYILLIISLVLCVLDRKEIFDKKIFRKPIKTRALLIILLIITFNFFGIKKLIDDNFNSKYEKNYGSINSASVRQPIFFKTGDKKVEIPNGVFDLAEFDPANFGNNILRIWVENNRIKIDVDIKNQANYLVCQIRNNEWKLNEGNYFDRNFDDNALEIKDKKSGNIVLQIDLSKKDILCVQAILPSTDSTVAIINGCDAPVMVIMSMLNTDDSVEKLLKIMPIIPIFKYPSGLNKGVRETNRIKLKWIQ